MFAFLAKKIALPKNPLVFAVSWNHSDGCICLGGENGLLKILKMAEYKQGKKPKKPLSQNISLDGHQGNINVIQWNDQYNKLTTSDDDGLIIVWMLHEDQWFEEMINNRKKSTVEDIKWSTDGTKVCIIYRDGAVIVGSVDGSREWGKELPHQLMKVEWSPDNKLLIFATVDGEARVYSKLGNPMHKIKIYCFQDMEVKDKTIASIEWYKNSKMNTDETPPGLAIAYTNGMV